MWGNLQRAGGASIELLSPQEPSVAAASHSGARCLFGTQGHVPAIGRHEWMPNGVQVASE
jgi:hypothetical protein